MYFAVFFKGRSPQDGARRGHVGVNLGLSCSMLGHLGAMLGYLGAMLGILGLCWVILTAFWTMLGSCCSQVGAKRPQMVKNLKL